MLVYAVGRSPQRLIIEDQVLEHFHRHQQRRWYQKEAGGQLFARISVNTISITEATGPRRTDKRSRFGYVADRRAERQEINERYLRGLHYIGDWHTHPERVPTPSGLDLESIAECVRKSEHGLNAFILAVVGTAELPDSLCILIHDGREAAMLTLDTNATSRTHLINERAT